MTINTLIILICLVLAQHSFITYPISLWLLGKIRPFKSKQAKGHDNLFIAVAMCCHNEEKILPQKIREFRDWLAEDASLSIYIYNDASTDKTQNIIDTFLLEFPDRVNAHIAESRTGKTSGMNTLISNMSENIDIVLFTDPAVRITGPVLKSIQETFKNEENGCVTGDLEFVNPNDSASTSVSVIFSRIQHQARLLEMKTGSVLGAGGTFFAIRKELYHKMPDYIMDDLHTSVHVVTQRKRAVYLDNIKVMKRAATKQIEEFKRKERIACRQMNVLKYIWPRLVKSKLLDQYKFHSKYTLRWFLGFFICGALMGALQLLTSLGYFSLSMLLLLVILSSIYMGHRQKETKLSQITNALAMLLAVSIGIIKSMLGVKYQTWQSARTIRKHHSN